MLIFVLFIVGIIIFGILFEISEIHDVNFLNITSGAFLIILTTFLIVFGIMAIAHNITVESDYYTTQEEYKVLIYQLKNDYYDNLLDLNKKELIDEVKKYNQEVISGRAFKQNRWVGVLYPMDYDSLELINLEDY